MGRDWLRLGLKKIRNEEKLDSITQWSNPYPCV